MRRNTVRAIILVMFLLFEPEAFPSGPQPPFAMIGWQIHERDVSKVAEAIQRAPEYRINFLVFSHDLFRSVENFLDSPEWQKDLLHLGALADEKKIPYYLWIHELDDIPKRFLVDKKRVNFDDPELFGFLAKRYERLLEVVPHVAGFVLTLREVDYLILRDSEVQSRLSYPDRICKLTRLIYGIAKKHNKQLILRNFFYEPREMSCFADAIAKLPDDIIVMSKSTCHEFNPFYPADPMHGNVGKKRQIMEIDLGVEKALGPQGAYAQVEDIRRYVRRAKEKGLAGAVGRARLIWDKPFEDSHEINLYAFSSFMANPDIPADQVYDAWVKKHYPADAVPFIISALKRTEYINHHGRYHLGFWLTKSLGVKWEKYSYYFGHIVLRSRYKWTQDPADKVLETKLLYPDMETYHQLIAEKDEVIRQVRASLADLEKAAPYVPSETMKPLVQSFEFLLDGSYLAREWTCAFFAHRLYIQDPREEYRKMTEDALEQLEKLDKAPGIPYGLDPSASHRYHIADFVKTIRSRLQNPEAAIWEDNAILEKMSEKDSIDLE